MASEESKFDLVKALASINVDPVKNAPNLADGYSNAERLDLDYERQKAELENLIDHQKQRKKFAGRIFYLTCAWITAVFGVLILDGFSWRGFHLSDSIVLAALGTTTANIIGVLLIVTNYFFPSTSLPNKSPDAGSLPTDGQQQS
ncbi:MAG: hypothetical protein ABSF17_19535 [Terracidiphilus sp.]|jgi:hypothetical protein